jgi:alpha-L-glutamate ligase-like protein
MKIKAYSNLLKAGVLGINRRNSDYLLKCNPRSAYPIVDNKILTKKLAVEHNIPTPEIYHIIERHGEVSGLGKKLEGRQEFVVKPARGTGGHGIILLTGRSGKDLVKQDGTILSFKDLSYHIQDILSGIYSLGGQEDSAIIEALVHPDQVFTSITYKGVPDTRIIVYRGVPVMGMVRLPTRASDGKANIHRGALGAGIDMETGKTLEAVHHSSVITNHPDTGNRISGIQIPYWRKILMMATVAFDMSGLGYLGADMVIDDKVGPVLLELNARPGLQIQIANKAGLVPRLLRVDTAPEHVFADAESRVTWAMEMFGVSDVI